LVCSHGGGTRLQLTVQRSDRPEEQRVVADVATAHVVWGLAAGSEYHWWFTDAEGGVRASGIHVADAGPVLAEVSVSGRLVGTDAVLTQVGCDGSERLVMVDGEGAVRWVGDPAAWRPSTTRVRGYGLTDEGHVLAILDNDQWVEVTPEGQLLLQVDRTAGHGRPFHHDLVRHGELTYVLDAREVEEGGRRVVYDGFTVYDAGGTEVAAWSAQGHLQPSQGSPCCGDYWGSDFPGAVDFAHSNSLTVSQGGDVLLTYRYIDAVQAVRGDPLHPSFGELLYTLVGRPDSPVPSDFVLIDPVQGDPSFGSPHHVQATEQGLRLYDNGWQPDRSTRILELALDVGAATATVTDALALGLYCPIQGSAFPVDDQWLTVCSGDDRIFTVDGDGLRTWEAWFTCPDGASMRPPYRAVPVSLPWDEPG
jgi:hypothetical protein